MNRELSKSFDMMEEMELSGVGRRELSRGALQHPMNAGYEMQQVPYAPVVYNVNPFVGYWDQFQQGPAGPTQAQYPNRPYSGPRLPYYQSPPPAQSSDSSTSLVLSPSHAIPQGVAPTRIVGELVPFAGHDGRGRVASRPYLAAANSQWASFDAAQSDAQQGYRYSQMIYASPRGRYMSQNMEMPMGTNSFGGRSPGSFQPYQHYKPIRATSPDMPLPQPPSGMQSGGPTSPRRQPRVGDREPVFSNRPRMLDTVGLRALSPRGSPSRFVSNSNRVSPSAASMPSPAVDRHQQSKQTHVRRRNSPNQQQRQPHELPNRTRVESELSINTRPEKLADDDTQSGPVNGLVIERTYSTGSQRQQLPPEPPARFAAAARSRDRVYSSPVAVIDAADCSRRGVQRRTNWLQNVALSKTTECEQTPSNTRQLQADAESASSRTAGPSTTGPLSKVSNESAAKVPKPPTAPEATSSTQGPSPKRPSNNRSDAAAAAVDSVKANAAASSSGKVENSHSQVKSSGDTADVSGKKNLNSAGGTGSGNGSTEIINLAGSGRQSRPSTPQSSGAPKEEGWLGLAGLGGVSRFIEQLLSPTHSYANPGIGQGPGGPPVGDNTSAGSSTAPSPPPERSGSRTPVPVNASSNAATSSAVGSPTTTERPSAAGAMAAGAPTGGVASEAPTARTNGGPPSTKHSGHNSSRTPADNEPDTAAANALPRRHSLQTEDSCEKLSNCVQSNGSGKRRATIKVLYSRALGVDKAIQTLPANVDPSVADQTLKIYSQNDLDNSLRQQRVQFEEKMTKMKAKYEMENFEAKDQYLMKLVNAREKIEALEQQLERAHILVGLESLTREAHSNTPDPEASYSSGGSASARSEQFEGGTHGAGRPRDTRSVGGGGGRGSRVYGRSGLGPGRPSGEFESCASENDLRRAVLRCAGSARDDTIPEETGAHTQLAPGRTVTEDAVGRDNGAIDEGTSNPNRTTVRVRLVDTTGLGLATSNANSNTYTDTTSSRSSATRASLPKQRSMDSTSINSNLQVSRDTQEYHF